MREMLKVLKYNYNFNSSGGLGVLLAVVLLGIPLIAGFFEAAFSSDTILLGLIISIIPFTMLFFIVRYFKNYKRNAAQNMGCIELHENKIKFLNQKKIFKTVYFSEIIKLDLRVFSTSSSFVFLAIKFKSKGKKSGIMLKATQFEKPQDLNDFYNNLKRHLPEDVVK